MKKSLLGLILSFCIVGFWPSLAQADTDQHCLTICMNGGNPAAICLPKCTYNQKQLHAGAKLLPSERNDVFDAPAPVDGLMLPNTRKAKTIGVEKDYHCIAQCTQNGMQYNLCEKACTKPDCLSGATLCTNTTAVSSGVTFVPPSTR